MQPLRWDLFCRVVDNHGDVGVCWRLAAELGRRGHAVRLWIDDAGALDWMAPNGAAGVTVHGWPADACPVACGDVVVEAFGGDLPAPVLGAMQQSPKAPLWLNLEYLSAEDYVERSHGLPSPVMAGPGAGLTRWFFYPGFTPATGGLLREADAVIDPPGPPDGGASVFCYANPMLPALAAHWPGPLRLTQGAAQSIDRPDAERLPWLTQPGYDALLRRCTLNFVRGEDSFVRAMWAGRPFVWQIYPQADGVHRRKLDAFLDRFLDGADPAFAAALRHLWRAWNGFAAWPPAWPDLAVWSAWTLAWRARLCAQPDLVTRLLDFVARRRPPSAVE